jgi:hypothetical protein
MRGAFDEERVQASGVRKPLTLGCLGSDPDDKNVDCIETRSAMQ